jgi:hypothetical protein
MKKTLTFSDFRDGFPVNYEEHFSPDGKVALYEYLTNLEDETGEQIEFDPIDLCCDFTEYTNFDDVQKDYDVKDLQDLEDRTTVIPLDNGGFIIQQF